ncbi:hypothetical protein [Arthrobacter sp. H35-D1]|uniref:hypothetical protein n=1 Tax=Arthrobacter sp. H35-D1 TaxID=3046202 RepID=UPI0024B99D14|nr:hypothetical protein [Arthrobacter sp. H35-D1]MDJ0311986.1 hypothetical protein [Arthrobacter sp. H35-D1]
MAHEAGDGTSFSVEGGVGSISYTLAEITEAGVGLASLAQHMDPLVDRLQAEWLWLGDAAQGASVFPYGPLEDMQNALWSCKGARADTARLAGRALQASANYAATETRAADAAALTGRIAAMMKGRNTRDLALLAPWTLAAGLATELERVRREGLRDAMERLLNNGVAAVAGALGSGVGFAYLLSQLRRQDAGSAGARPAYALRKFFDTAGLARSGNLAIRQVPAREWDTAAKQLPPGHAIVDPSAGDPWEMEASIRGMLAGSQDAYGYPPGSIAVVRIVRPDGQVSWVVHLPGTEDWSTIDSANPFDMEGNLEGLTAAWKEHFTQEQVLVQEFIKAALESSGALPGEEVVLTGHSGGGIHAAAAAADSAFLASVNVKMIVIAGAPAKNANVPATISVLDVENDNDVVTAADYGPPPASKNWVTVTSHRPPIAEGGVGAAVQEAHSLENYMADAGGLDSSADPAVQASREALRNLLGAGVGAGAMVKGTKFVYQGRDSRNKSTKDRPVVTHPVPGKGKDYAPGAR